ncbi:MalY/PatB family protein [Niallia sp. HCP3S3_B10]|uniref:MalY/PatB family protein n=1 Tax=Niallia sp. HCP3S3_B10 TaxID=3438944 RepID=UPI003F8AB405
MYDFNKIIPRKNTNSAKWDRIINKYDNPEILPFWLADMDLLPFPELIEEIQYYSYNNILGYFEIPDTLYSEIIHWEYRHYCHKLTRNEIFFSPSVVTSISIAIQAFTKQGESVLINEPVYSQFSKIIQLNERNLVINELLKKNCRFEIDIEKMEQQIILNNVKLYILCNPHNPGGRVWTKQELKKIGDLCKKHKIIVISDEIHQDLVFKPHKHISFSLVDSSFDDFTIKLTSATKSFNIAALKCSMAFIKNSVLREKFFFQSQKNNLHEINTLGYIGTEIAYRNGDIYLEELKNYIQKNITIFCNYLKIHLPRIKYMYPEGTYLIWLDFSSFGLNDKELYNKLIFEAQIALSPGVSFGNQGQNHMRFNVACPRKLLMEGLYRLKEVFS